MLDEELLWAEVEAKEARMKRVLWSPPEERTADQDAGSGGMHGATSLKEVTANPPRSCSESALPRRRGGRMNQVDRKSEPEHGRMRKLVYTHFIQGGLCLSRSSTKRAAGSWWGWA